MGVSLLSPAGERRSHILAVAKDMRDKLALNGWREVVCYPSFVEGLASFLQRLPPGYMTEYPEDILLHARILNEARDPDRRPALHCRFVECIQENGFEDLEFSNEGSHGENDDAGEPVHEIIFSTVARREVLTQICGLFAEMTLDIYIERAYKTADGYLLGIFLVHGWNQKEPGGLEKLLNRVISRSTWKELDSVDVQLERLLKIQREEDWKFEISSLKIGEKIESRSRADLYHGLYVGVDVTVKLFNAESMTGALKDHFLNEIRILRQADEHTNVIRLVGASTIPPHLCILTEYVHRGSLNNYLHEEGNILSLHQILQFALDICKGMYHLHQLNIIHRDLRTSNLLLDSNNVIKVSNFGLAHFVGEKRAGEVGAYKWMAPEVMMNEPYDRSADVYSFGIVLWELATSREPYENMSPIQAAMSVVQGKRPEPLPDTDRRLVDLMQRCWDETPPKRPDFSRVILSLESIMSSIGSGRS